MFSTHVENDRFYFLSIIIFLVILAFPFLIYAETGDILTYTNANAPSGLVPCNGTAAYPCDFNAFVSMINGIINWIISIAGVIFAISLIYGGFLYMTSGEKPDKKATAKKILWNTLIGFVIILIAWLIVYTILNTLVPKDADHNSIFKFIGGR